MRKEGTKTTNNAVKEIKNQGLEKITKSNAVKDILGQGFEKN